MKYRYAYVILILLLAVCLFVLAFAFQGARGIWQPDEGYYVGAALSMLKTGNLFIPHLGQEIFLEKPPMIYWGLIAGMKLFGHNEFGARVFHALCYAATVLLVGLLAFHLFGRKREAVTASLVYGTMVVPFMAANFVTPDTPLTLWTTLAGFFFYKSIEPNARRPTLWRLLLSLAVGLGFLAKGPAALIPCAGMFAFLVVRGQVAKYFFTPWAILGMLIFCIIGLGWYFYVAVNVPGAASYFVDNEIWGRLISAKYHRNPSATGALIYPPVIAFGSLPWSLIWWEKRRRIQTTVLKKAWWASLRHRPVALFLLTWFLVPLLVLCLASSKLGLYSLPIFAPFALATARLWSGKIGQLPSPLTAKNLRYLARPAILIGCWLLLLPGGKLALAHYPTRKDARALWAEVESYINTGPYEIVTIDEHADGLIFYGATEVENITVRENPYPTFSVPEHILKELRELPLDNHSFLFLIKDEDHALEIRSMLSRQGLHFEEVALAHGRRLLIYRPARQVSL